MKLCILKMVVFLLACISSPVLAHGFQTGQGNLPVHGEHDGVLLVAQGPSADAPRQVQPGPDPGTVDPEWFASVIRDLPPGIHLVDVRPEHSFARAHLQGSVNIPAREALEQGCESIYSRLPREGTVIFICVTGRFSRAMYSRLLNTCQYPEMDRIYVLNARIDYEAGTLESAEE